MIEIWNHCKKELKKKLGEANYASYIEPTEPVSYELGTLSVKVSSSFVAAWLEKNISTDITELLANHTGQECKVTFLVNDVKPKRVAVTPAVAAKKAVAKHQPMSTFKPQYNFNNFVKGKCNEFAYASAYQSAQKPGEQYNPLFLYGGVGLGKTHLMQAIGQEILRKNPSANVLFLSSEQFVNQMISALQKGTMEKFRNTYRNLDALLVDDIQFIAGKDRTQEEFFHTFNTLFEMGKQIVVSSDQFPKEIKKLEERLKSRFEWGLIADIQAPDFETKVAIIQKKAKLNNYNITLDVATYLAETIKSNVRELEGCLARVAAYASLSGRPINLELAMETLEGVYRDAKKNIDVDQIKSVVAEHYNIRLSDFKAKSRSRKVVIPRQLAMFLCREITDESLPEIGRAFGGRDHSTVIHAYKKVKADIEVNTRLYNDLVAIKKALGL